MEKQVHLTRKGNLSVLIGALVIATACTSQSPAQGAVPSEGGVGNAPVAVAPGLSPPSPAGVPAAPDAAVPPSSGTTASTETQLLPTFTPAASSGLAPEAAAPSPAPASPTGVPAAAATTRPPEPAPPAFAITEPTAAATQVPIGYSVGERVPDFQLQLADGSTFSSQDLISEGRPVFLFFTASW